MPVNMSRTAHRKWCRQRRRLGGFVLGVVVATLNVALPVSGTLTAQQSTRAEIFVGAMQFDDQS